MGDGEGVEEEGRDGMVYGGVTMGKCFYCMLLAPLARARLRAALAAEERYLSPPFPGIPS